MTVPPEPGSDELPVLPAPSQADLDEQQREESRSFGRGAVAVAVGCVVPALGFALTGSPWLAVCFVLFGALIAFLGLSSWQPRRRLSASELREPNPHVGLYDAVVTITFVLLTVTSQLSARMDHLRGPGWAGTVVWGLLSLGMLWEYLKDLRAKLRPASPSGQVVWEQPPEPEPGKAPPPEAMPALEPPASVPDPVEAPTSTRTGGPAKEQWEPYPFRQ